MEAGKARLAVISTILVPSWLLLTWGAIAAIANAAVIRPAGTVPGGSAVPDWAAGCAHACRSKPPPRPDHDRGIRVHVWVDETRPRNQGARLTAWELGQHGVPFAVIADNTGGHLMQHGLVDLVITGSDRTTYTGDVTNKIGTYLKALAAHDNHLPFYTALPSSTFDWETRDGLKEIPIEQRNAGEVTSIQGLLNGQIVSVVLTSEDSILALYPEHKKQLSP